MGPVTSPKKQFIGGSRRKITLLTKSSEGFALLRVLSGIFLTELNENEFKPAQVDMRFLAGGDFKLYICSSRRSVAFFLRCFDHVQNYL